MKENTLAKTVIHILKGNLMNILKLMFGTVANLRRAYVKNDDVHSDVRLENDSSMDEFLLIFLQHFSYSI